MAELTKEWLQQTIAELEEERDATPGAVNEDATNALAAMKLALESLEAEPVAYIRDGFRADGVHFCGGIITAEEHERTKPALSDRYTWKHQPLYTAPPASVSVPDEMDGHGGVCCEVSYADGWNACRAAMLQGAEPVSNRDELPGGWVACSERMPEGMTDVHISNGHDVGQGWWDGDTWQTQHDYYSVPGEVTHWMPLPASPQQK